MRLNMDKVKFVIIFVSISILFLVSGMYFFIRRLNLKSLNQELTELEKKENNVKNQNFSLFLGVISIALCLFFGILPLFYPSNSTNSNIQPTNNNDSISTTQSTTNTHSDSKHENTSQESDISNQNNTEITKINTVYEDNTENEFNNYNIITEDCVLEDVFTKSSNKKYYILQTTYNSEYGFDFDIDNINSSYSMSIVEEKGKVLYEFDVPSNNDVHAIKLEKNSSYNLIIEANIGYPKFSIKISYPDNDNF